MEVFNMDIHILDDSFNFIGIIDTYTSLIWRPAYYDVGDFELYLDASVQNVELLPNNNFS